MGIRKPQYRDLLDIEKPWETNDMVWTDPSGQYKIVRVGSQWDYGLEGYFLGHCLGTKDFDEFERRHRVYSLRDALDIPHCTILCQHKGQWSEYGGSSDLGTRHYFRPEEDPKVALEVLQVRGRLDQLAHLPFHRLVRDWYVNSAGYPFTEKVHRALDSICSDAKYADFDFIYHYRYLLDESRNAFQWAYHNDELREAYKPR